MTTTILTINGMTCTHCAQAVGRALRAVTGVASAEVDLAQARATVLGEASVDELIAAVKKQGYGAEVSVA